MTDADDNTSADDEPGVEALPLGTRAGRARMFALLSCGFLVCMCCVTGTFAGLGLSWMRMSQLAGTVEAVGMPTGWTMEDSSALPWGAQAELSGPVDVPAVTDWLRGLGVESTESEVTGCLEGEKCEVNLTWEDEEVAVTYSGKGDQAQATVEVG